MAYQTGTATDTTDLMGKLNTFAAANGYTTNYHNATTRFLALQRTSDSLYVSFYWTNTDGFINLYQALGFSATYQETPWLQANDSGNGANNLSSPNYQRGRQVSSMGPGPFTKYHFFAYTSPSYAIHVVVEFSSGLYRHFGFGKINKTGTWVGGAWVAGHLWSPGGSTPQSQYDAPNSGYHSVLMDGIMVQGQTYSGTYNDNAGGTLHCEGLPGQPATSKWGQSMNKSTNDGDNFDDRAGNPRVRIGGGCRAGVALSQFGHFLPDLSNGFIPIIPFEHFYYDAIGGGDGWYYLGRMENCGHIHLHGIDPAQEITVGSDTWIAFPMVRKSYILNNNQESWNAGIIYKKVV